MALLNKLNLSTRPFRNRFLPYFVSAVLLGISVLLIGLFLLFYKQNSDGVKQYAGLIAAREARLKDLKGEGEKIQQELTPDQKAVLSAAHKLVANKRFGWSRFFADLESVMPANVSASRITVQNVYTDGDRLKAELELAVLAKDYAGVMSMIENMQNSGLFQAELRGQDLQRTDRMTFTEYTLHIIYSPGYSYSAAPGGDVAANGGGQ